MKIEISHYFTSISMKKALNNNNLNIFDSYQTICDYLDQGRIVIGNVMNGGLV